MQLKVIIPILIVTGVGATVLMKQLKRAPAGPPIPVETGPLTDGLYAHVTTNMGEMVLQLDYERAPVTCANFMFLAEGTKAWRDPKEKKLVNRPLYDGTKFHRVKNGFMIQGGDPLGTGAGGPGYEFKDEFHPDLKFDKPGVLAMANNGKHTNGSQFFITLSKQEKLDGEHSIFGKIVRGQDVLVKIGAVETDATERPETPVVMEKVTIERIGDAAKSWLSRTKDIPPATGEVDPTRVPPAPDAPEKKECSVIVIAIQWKDLEPHEPGVTATKEEAAATAAKILAHVRLKGSDPVTLARRWSDLPVVLQDLSRGQTLDPNYKPAFQIEPGQVSDVCETVRGYVIFIGR